MDVDMMGWTGFIRLTAAPLHVVKATGYGVDCPDVTVMFTELELVPATICDTDVGCITVAMETLSIADRTVVGGAIRTIWTPRYVATDATDRDAELSLVDVDSVTLGPVCLRLRDGGATDNVCVLNAGTWEEDEDVDATLTPSPLANMLITSSTGSDLIVVVDSSWSLLSSTPVSVSMATRDSSSTDASWEKSAFLLVPLFVDFVPRRVLKCVQCSCAASICSASAMRSMSPWFSLVMLSVPSYRKVRNTVNA
jgi:hypothetical protein